MAYLMSLYTVKVPDVLVILVLVPGEDLISNYSVQDVRFSKGISISYKKILSL